MAMQLNAISTDDREIAVILVAWEMTKVCLDRLPGTQRPESVREEYAKNYKIVFEAYRDRGDSAAD